MTITSDYGSNYPGTDQMPNTDIDLALKGIGSALEGYEHAQEYDSVNMWDRWSLSREGRTLRQADIEFDPNLCLGPETTAITRHGVRALGDMDGETVELWTADGWRKGTIAKFGRQQLQEVEFVTASWTDGSTDRLGRTYKPGWRRQGTAFRVRVRATANHLWELADGTETRALAVGDVVRAQVAAGPDDTAAYDAGWVHGMIFADGRRCNAKRTPNSISYEIRLCGEKARHLWRFEQSPIFVSVRYPASANGEPMVYLRTGVLLKDFPQNEDPDYVRGFVAGWLAGDGDQHRAATAAPGTIRLHTCDVRAEAWLRDHAATAGWLLTGFSRWRADGVKAAAAGRHVPLRDAFSFMLVQAVRAWEVTEIGEPTPEEDVYCATVPGIHRFTLASGVYTGNCSPVIDAVNDRLLITSVTASAGAAEDSAASDGATNLVARVRAENELETRYRSWNRNTLRDGDGYVIVWPDQVLSYAAQPELTGNIDVENVAIPLGVNITYADPRNCRMFYDPENPRRKVFFAQMWVTTLPGEKQERIRVNLSYPDRIEKWISSEGTRDKRASDFEHFEDDTPGLSAGGEQLADAVWPMPNPYGKVPAFHLRTDFDYGKPEHRNAFAEQAGISDLVEKMMVTAEFSSYPQRWALMQQEALASQSIRDDPFAEHSFADQDRDYDAGALSTTSINTGSMSNETGSGFEASPGSMQLFKGFSQVGQFETADTANFLNPIKQFAQMISTATSTPLWKFSGIGAVPPSGEALKVEESSLVQKVLDRIALLGGEWERIYEFALEILGVTAEVSVSWASPTTNDLKEVWDLVQQMVATGVPRAVALMKAGVPEAQAQEWANTYSTLFAEAEYQQGRAKMYLAQADLLTQQAVAAKIANGVPESVALVEGGYKQADVDEWLADREMELTLGRKVQLFSALTLGMQQLSMVVSTDIITKEGANAIVTALFGDLLPEIPQAMLEIPEEDDEPEPVPPQFAGQPPMMPPGSGMDDGSNPGMAPGFSRPDPIGSPKTQPIPMEDR